MKSRRVFFHYRRSTGGMTVHFQKKCIPCIDVVCEVPIETKRNKVQPFLVMQGFAKQVDLIGNTVYIK